MSRRREKPPTQPGFLFFFRRQERADPTHGLDPDFDCLRILSKMTKNVDANGDKQVKGLGKPARSTRKAGSCVIFPDLTAANEKTPWRSSHQWATIGQGSEKKKGDQPIFGKVSND